MTDNPNKKSLWDKIHLDPTMLLILLALLTYSALVIWSASGQDVGMMERKIGQIAMGVVIMIVMAQIPPRVYEGWAPYLYIFCIILLVAVDAFGAISKGAQRWLDLGIVRFQPSEIAKGAMVLATAQILSALQTEKGADKLAFRYILMVCGAIVPLIMVENLSTALLLCLVIFMMMLLGRVPARQLGALLGIVVLAVALLVCCVMAFGTDEEAQKLANQTLTEQTIEQKKEDKSTVERVFHRFDTWKSRINKFLAHKDVAPKDVDLDKDAQVAHANIAIATSNIMGKGPGNSEERDFVSQAFSDFIYAIIIEETGILGATGVAMLYIILLFRTGRIASRCENNFPAFFAMGLALLLVTQALFNMCVAVGLVPVTGQPLPFISKGGTATIINCVYIGAILSVSRSAQRKQKIIADTNVA